MSATDLGIATFVFKMPPEALEKLNCKDGNAHSESCKVIIDYIEINERDRHLVLTLCNEHGVCDVKATPNTDEDFDNLVERYEGGGIGGSYYLDKAICEFNLEVGYVDLHI